MKREENIREPEEGYVVVNRRRLERSALRRHGPPSEGCNSHSEPISRDVSVKQAEDWEKELLQDPKNRLALTALSSNPLTSVLTSRTATIADQSLFNVLIPHEGSPVTNQRSSGRCWLFASTNVFRVALMKKYDLAAFELSQAYLFFWDKLEKANYFLENVLETSEEALDGRLVQTLMQSPVGDGGQWDMVANLVNKYGLVPQALYPDSFNAMNSSAMDRLLTTMLREAALRLRGLKAKNESDSTMARTKTAVIKNIYGVLCLTLGPPPSPNEPFTWSYYTASEPKTLKTLAVSPLRFAHSLRDRSTLQASAFGGTDVHSLFSIVHDPRNKPYTLLSVKHLGNVWGGQSVTYVNAPIDVLKQAAIKMLKRGWPVFFGCDVGKYSDSKRGIMDTALFDYDLAFNVHLSMSKAERLQVGESQMTHAMVLTGVHIEHDKPVRWRVENSWSEAVGDKGYFVMTDRWFDEFTYQVVVDPLVVDDKVKDVLDTDPARLELWDPMGALA